MARWVRVSLACRARAPRPQRQGPRELLQGSAHVPGGAGAMMGPRDPVRALSEDWGIDLEGEVVALVGDVPMGATPAQAADAVRLLTLVNDVSFRRLIPAELAKGFGFVNGKGANALAPVAATPDELGERWRDGRIHLRLTCEVNGARLGNPDAGADAQFGLH